MGRVGVDVRVGEVRHHGAELATRLEHAGSLADQTLGVGDVLEEVLRVDGSHRSVGQRPQHLESVADHVDSRQFDQIDADGLREAFGAAAPEFEDQGSLRKGRRCTWAQAIAGPDSADTAVAHYNRAAFPSCPGASSGKGYRACMC
jgi:hypothetical protein